MVLGILLKGTKPDIFCFRSESRAGQLPETVLNASGFSAFFSPSKLKKGYSGVAIYSRIEPLSVIYGMGRRISMMRAGSFGAEYDDFWLLNIYFPKAGRGPDRLDFRLLYLRSFSGPSARIT